MGLHLARIRGELVLLRAARGRGCVSLTAVLERADERGRAGGRERAEQERVDAEGAFDSLADEGCVGWGERCGVECDEWRGQGRLGGCGGGDELMDEGAGE